MKQETYEAPPPIMFRRFFKNRRYVVETLNGVVSNMGDMLAILEQLTLYEGKVREDLTENFEKLTLSDLDTYKDVFNLIRSQIIIFSKRYSRECKLSLEKTLKPYKKLIQDTPKRIEDMYAKKNEEIRIKESKDVQKQDTEPTKKIS